MGGKRPGERQYIRLCIALLTLLVLLGCAFERRMSAKMADPSGEEGKAHLALGRKFLVEGNFTAALAENKKVLSLAGRNAPVDEAFFALALIHAHAANPARDLEKSLALLRILIKNHQGSPLVQQAKIIADLIQDNDNVQRRVERLNNIIEEQQRTVTGSEAKMAEQAKTIADLTQENEKLSRNIEKLTTIIDELKKVDIDVDQKKKRDKTK